MSNAEQFRAQVAAMGPGLILEVDETSDIYSQAFLVGDMLVVFPLDPEDRVVGIPIDAVTSVPDYGFGFDSPRHLLLGIWKLGPFIDPDLAEFARNSGGRTQDFAETYVRGNR